MSYQNSINTRRGTANAIFHKFRTAIKPGRELHLFVEGYDDICLYDRLLSDLKGLFGSRWHTYICLGKNNMDRIVQLLRESAFSDRNVLFVRDSDFDRFLGTITADDNIFLTCGYSVENYVCTEYTISRFMRSTFGVDPNEVNIDASSARHVALVNDLFEWMSPVVGAALYAVRSGVQLDLNRLPVSDMYRLLYKGDPLPDTFPKADIDKCGILPEHFNVESLKLGKSFSQLDAMRWLRGKYLLECTSVFLFEERSFLHNEYRLGNISRFNKKNSSDYSAPATFERLCAVAPGTDELRLALSKGLGVAA